MNNIEQLLDNQLIELFKSDYIDKDLKSKIIQEIDRRDLEKIEIKEHKFTFSQKAFIFFTNYFLYKYHLQKANQLIMIGDKKSYKLYWRIFSFGVGFSFIVLLLIAKFYLSRLV
ncbi:hypothetical protein [Flavobacterium columnare]|uniref:hypothetical protein n=1 Tax=Flavobacterium covae TaxID=2906076 RepID=UPI000B5C0CC8|nr:hypothetical protein B0A56_05730 [Flavobacterium columnare NBRC 100251 = ATCC 23463]